MLIDALEVYMIGMIAVAVIWVVYMLAEHFKIN